MKFNRITAIRQIITISFSCLISIYVSAQNLQATFDTTINTLCNGAGCNYQGPSILINELMISPNSGDGSLSGNGGVSTGRGEWIELYNPNLCEPVDISCYYLGNYTYEGTGGFRIPNGTIVPPGGFCLIRGGNVTPVPSNLLYVNGGNVIEIVVPYNVTDAGVCSGGNRLWFPNAGGWFAFYDANGVPQDAVAWGNSNLSDRNGNPCIPSSTGCPSAASLASYNNIPSDRKTVVTTVDASTHMGQSIRRDIDGGTWNSYGSPTYADCNATCIPTMSSTCNGVATIHVTGGTPPYSYAWNDSEAQLTQTATGLCAGIYTCQVTDVNGETQSFQVEIIDFVPDVTMSIQEEICIDGGLVTPVGSPQPGGAASGVFSGTGITGNSFDPAAAGSGQHAITYTYTDENGCQNSASDAITVNPLPVVTITNVASPYCSDIQDANIQFSPAGGQLSGTGTSGNQFHPSQAGAGSHTLTYAYTDANGCENSTTVTVDVIEATPPTITAVSDLCIDGDSVTIQVSPAGGQFQVNGSNASLTFFPGDYGSGIHTLTYSYTDVNSCIGTTTESIHVHDLPVIDMNLDPVYCYGSGFIAVVPQPAGGTFTGDNVVSGGLNLTGTDPGNYSVHYEVTDQFGCYSEQTSNYVVSTPITPAFEYEVNCFQNIQAVAAPVHTSYQYSWDLGSGNASGTVLNHYFEEPGNYPLTLTITDQHGCQYTVADVVHVPKGVSPSDYTVPNVITPNGDGINDFLEMPLLMDECFTYKIIILNRWGSVVFEMLNHTSIFDGHDKNGNELTEGVYFYQVQSDDFDCNDPELKGFCSGFITIVR